MSRSRILRPIPTVKLGILRPIPTVKLGILRPIPTVKLAKVARAIRRELEYRAEYATKFGISAPGQFCPSSYYPKPPVLPLAIALLALMTWLALR